MVDESSLHPPNAELEKRAKLFAERATKLLEELKGVEGDIAFKSMTALHYFLQSQSCYAELNRREAIERADRDKRESEERADQDRKRENRHFRIELFFTVLVTLLIGLELYLSIHYGRLSLQEGKQQADILEDMKRSTAATATLQTETLQLLRKQEADRLAQLAKRPQLVLYVGHVRLANPHGPLKPSQETDNSAIFDFVLRNVGDASANKIIFRALVPPDIGGVSSNTPFFPIYPASDLPDRPVRAFLLPQESLRAKNYMQFSLTFLFPKGHPPFPVMFNADAEEIRSDTPLGVLTITPRNSAGQSAPPAPPKL